MVTAGHFAEAARRPGSLHELMQRSSTIAFLALPLIAVLIADPAGSAIYLIGEFSGFTIVNVPTDGGPLCWQ